jgi:hypothetical protein
MMEVSGLNTGMEGSFFRKYEKMSCAFETHKWNIFVDQHPRTLIKETFWAFGLRYMKICGWNILEILKSFLGIEGSFFAATKWLGKGSGSLFRRDGMIGQGKRVRRSHSCL